MSETWLARYKLLQRIGSGGMAEVFRAELVGAEGVTRELVVKRIHPRLALDPRAVAMFVEEARIAARLRHPHVVQVVEFGRAGDDYFLAMELVEGCDLATLLRREGRLALPVAWEVIDPLLDALVYVHEFREGGRPMGLVHRDVTPHNVLLGDAGEVKLADFGIARVARSLTPDDAAVRGKLHFMAPEQCRGDVVDARADQFSAAAVAYQCLTGQRPIDPEPADTLVARVREGAVIPLRARWADAPDGVAAVIDRALSADPDARFDTTRAFRAALTEAVASAGVRGDRDALRAAVVRVAGGDVAPRADRTLTVDEPPAEAVPESTPPVPARRRLLERAAIAVGVFVVAVLAERRTRPTAAHPPPPRVAPAGRTATLALPADTTSSRWFASVRDALARQCACEVRAVSWRSGAELEQLLETGAVDVALVSGLAFPALAEGDRVRRLDTLLPEVDRAGWIALRTAMRPEALRLGAASGASGEGTYLLPATVDAVVLATRTDAVRRAADAFMARRASVVERMTAAHTELPRGFTLRPAVDEWTTWDLLAAASLWRDDGGRLWVPTGDDERSLTVLLARRATHDPDGDRRVPTDPRGMSRLAATDALLATWGAWHPDVVDPRGHVEVPWDDPSLRAAWITASQWATCTHPEAWRMSRLPRGDELTVSDAGEALGLGARVASGRVTGFVVARGTQRPQVAAALTLALGAANSLRPLSLAGRTLAARRDLDPSRDPSLTVAERAIARADLDALESNRFGMVGGPRALDAVDRIPAEVMRLWRMSLPSLPRDGGP